MIAKCVRFGEPFFNLNLVIKMLILCVTSLLAKYTYNRKAVQFMYINSHISSVDSGPVYSSPHDRLLDVSRSRLCPSSV